MNNNFFFCNDKAAAIMAAVKNKLILFNRLFNSKFFQKQFAILWIFSRYCKLTFSRITAR